MKCKCSSCGYSFIKKGIELPKICPYCGRENAVTCEEETTFSDIDELTQ